MSHEGSGERGTGRVRVGVTGHRALRAMVSIEALIDTVLASVPVPATLVTSLAEGADRVAAIRALARPDWSLEVVLPLAPEDYETDFVDDASRAAFRDLLDRAANVTQVPVTPTREGAYLAAGLAMLDQSTAVLALWDGAPARGRGGTAEIVATARERGLPIAWIHVERGGAADEVAMTTDSAREGAHMITEECWPWPR